MDKMLFAVVLAVVAAGCETVRPGPRRGYLDHNEDVFGSASSMEYTQKRLAITKVIEQMLTDPMFTEQYDAAMSRAVAANRTRPTIAVRPIENNTGDGRGDAAATGQMYRELLTALRKTKKFEMIDYARRKQMTQTVVSAVDAGEAPSNLQSIGSYVSADFIMTGELRREFTDDVNRKVYHHFLNLEMTDTATGSVFWSDTAQPTVKFE